MRTTWTDARLHRLFERYRVAYWPRSRRLPHYRVEAAALSDCMGIWDPEERVLRIDLVQHGSDREVRATVLHEMVHAVLGRGGHHAPFWSQLEYLLSRRAPITVGFPELGERGMSPDVIPQRFKRCRRLFVREFNKEQRRIATMPLGPTINLTPEMVEQEIQDWMLENGSKEISWRVLWQVLVSRYGFVDLDGRLRPWARPYRVAARRGYLSGRQIHRENKEARARFQALEELPQG